MHKIITRVLRNNIILYTVCVLAFAVLTVQFSIPLAVLEMIVALAAFFISYQRSKKVQRNVRQYVDRMSGGMDSAVSSNMLASPLPIMVFDVKKQEILWTNEHFMMLSEQKEGIFDARVSDVVPGFGTHWLLEGKQECPELVNWNYRQYRVFGSVSHLEETAPDAAWPHLLDGCDGAGGYAPDTGRDPTGGGDPDDG